MDLLDKALALCEEIEVRQNELRAIVRQLADMRDLLQRQVSSDICEKAEAVRKDDVAPECDAHPQCDDRQDEASVVDQKEECVVSDDTVEVDTQAEEQADMTPADMPPVNDGEPVSAPSEREDTEVQKVAAVASRVTGDLRKAFTINDRFRFRRELFAGDDRAMHDVIDRLSALSSYGEAESYVASLGWDRESEAAAEFMAVLNNFFNGYRL